VARGPDAQNSLARGIGNSSNGQEKSEDRNRTSEHVFDTTEK